MLLIYRHRKWLKAVGRCEERVKKSDDECDFSLDETNPVQFKDDITVI